MDHFHGPLKCSQGKNCPPHELRNKIEFEVFDCGQMASVLEIRSPDEADRQTVKEFFYAMPLIERGRPVFDELLWVLHDRPNEGEHDKILPDYCYNVLDALRMTFFKNFLGQTDIFYIKDPQGLSAAKTIEDAKKVIQVDWKNLGRMCGIGARCLRFAELEAANGVDGEGFGDCTADKVKEIFTIVFGTRWVKENAARIVAENPDKLFSEMLNESIASSVQKLVPASLTCEAFAWQWSAAAVQEFQAGLAEGWDGFLDIDGQLVGETTRSETYVFLLLAWPEIKVLQGASPRKTVTDLHAWMLPFMRVGVTTQLDIDTFRDLCAPPSQKGIGLSLRPLKSSGASA